MRRVALTTIDNPHSPFTDFKNWYHWDVSNGYHSSALLARLTFSSDELSESDQLVELENAIDEIVSENYSGMHLKVVDNSS